MQIRYQKILARKFKYRESEDTIPEADILTALIKATGKSNSYIRNHPDEYLEGEPLQKFNQLLKRLKKSK